MLFDKLTRYGGGGDVPMHMPGHKRNTGLLGGALPYAIDITEIPGFDDLHDMRGVLADTSALAAGVYGASRAFPLINGTTGGILAAVSALTRRGDAVIMSRVCHKSVYNAVEINMLRPRYVLPSATGEADMPGSVTPESVEDAFLRCPEARLVIITSPTYDGVVSDVRRIADIVHAHGAALLTDAAHGAHLRFSERLPDGAENYADVTVMSLHKTLPALTQCSLLLTSGGRVDADAIARQLAVYETSSPSYVLLSSIDACVRLLDARAPELFGTYMGALDEFYESVRELKTLRVVGTRPEGCFDRDKSKILISTRFAAMRGRELYDTLRLEHKIVAEMYAADSVLALSSVCDTQKSLRRLSSALTCIDTKLSRRDEGDGARGASRAVQNVPEQKIPPGEAAALAGELVRISDAIGRVSAEYLYAYPPGVPIIVPGEVVDEGVLRAVAALTGAGISLRSTFGKEGFLSTVD